MAGESTARPGAGLVVQVSRLSHSEFVPERAVKIYYHNRPALGKGEGGGSGPDA